MKAELKVPAEPAEPAEPKVLAEKIGVCIIGLGRIGSLLEEDSLREKPCTHAGAVAANDDLILLGGCDQDEERRELFSRRWKVPVYADAAEMLREQKPGIVHIATHPDSHYHYCALAKQGGVKISVCEKPLADSLGAARKLVRLCDGTFRVITNHERRYSADYQRAHVLLAGGSLGEILSVRATLYMGKNQRLLDVLWHDGTHLADALMYLTGMLLRHSRSWGTPLRSPKGVDRQGRPGTAWLEAVLQPLAALQPPGDLRAINSNPAIPCLIEAGAGRDHLVFEMEFSCSRGRLRIGNGLFEVWESGPSPYAEKFRSLKRVEEGFPGPTGYFANMVKDAVSCYRDPRREPLSSAACGLRVIEWLHALGRRRVFFT